MGKFNWDNQVAFYIDQGYTPEQAQELTEEDWCEYESEMDQLAKDRVRGLK